MKRCFALRHVPFESLGLLEPLLRARDYLLEFVDVPITNLRDVPLTEADLLVVLGGPIGVYEEQSYPWLTYETRVLEARLKAGLPTIGICLGAQLMAKALGSKVYPTGRKEIGWGELTLTASGKKGPLDPLDGQSVLHWHGDTFDLPQGATLLASTAMTPHQAFSFGGRAYGLQFHVEVTARDLEGWYVGHAAELANWPGLTVAELRSSSERCAPMLEAHAVAALTNVLDTIA
ncbi:MAG TPA: glutamine amidotransferase [Polyangiaceae bacterium]|nr:glutamine amidotransferase [Polyangiaceae bacterium]